MSDPLLLIGCGGHARSLIDVVESSGCHILGLVGLPEQVGEEVLGYPVLGCDQDLPSLRHSALMCSRGWSDWLCNSEAATGSKLAGLNF